MAEIYTSEVQATEGGGSKFAGVRANTGAAGEFLAIAGDTVVTEQGKRVASARVNVATTAGAGQTIGTTTEVAVEGDTAGSLSAKLRGLLKGLGLTTDAASAGAGTIQAKLRAIAEILNQRLHLTGTNVTVHTWPAIATTSTTALATNASRVYALLINDSDTAMYLKIGVAAVLSQGIRLNANGGSYVMSGAYGNLDNRVINAIHGGLGTKVLLVSEG